MAATLFTRDARRKKIVPLGEIEIAEGKYGAGCAGKKQFNGGRKRDGPGEVPGPVVTISKI
jgi:hypothetical protein